MFIHQGQPECPGTGYVVSLGPGTEERRTWGSVQAHGSYDRKREEGPGRRD